MRQAWFVAGFVFIFANVFVTFCIISKKYTAKISKSVSELRSDNEVSGEDNEDENCDGILLTLDDSGGIADNLVQFAVLMVVSKRLKIKPVLTTRLMLLDNYFHLEASPLSDHFTINNPETINVTYDESMKANSCQDFGNAKLIRIIGVPFDPEFLVKNRYTILEHLKFREGLTIDAKRYLDNIKERFGTQNTSISFVAVHQTLKDAGYISNAMELVKSKLSSQNKTAIFILNCKNLKICRASFKSRKDVILIKTVVKTNLGNRLIPAFDLAVLSMCEHFIISSGAFGFISAFLSTKAMSADSLKINPCTERIINNSSITKTQVNSDLFRGWTCIAK